MANLRKLAEGQSCVICGANDGTVVLAHLPTIGITDSGMALKCPDWFGCHACMKCHQKLDQGEWRRDYYVRHKALYQTLKRLFEKGKIK